MSAGAGTDANVHIQLYGKDKNTRKDKNTGKILLKHSKRHQNKFERGSCEEFDIIAKDIGDLTKIK